MIPIKLEVNGRPIEVRVEPRQHLADFLREEMLLTATHLGCEHGVCGACTVLIDGAPARSCIAFPAMLDGARITTVEGLADDAVAAELREAFMDEHGLQCGFCTPGMLVMARDIVLRRPQADEDVIRHELAGNLCRCTGYVGIIRAIRKVAAGRADAVVTRGTVLEPPAYASPLALPVSPARVAVEAPLAPSPAAAMAGAGEGEAEAEPLRNPVELSESFEVPAPRAEVWALFQSPEQVIACLPGARLTAPSDGRTLKAEMVVKLGPMQAAFGGAGRITPDAANWSGTIDGRGVDARSATQVRARLGYRLAEIEADAATRVSVDVAYVLQGPLAQMSRGAIARDVAARLTQAFAANLAATVKGETPAAQNASLDAGALAWSVIKGWLARLFGRG
ncbi:xanthine dehydrogenase family Fe-S subunit [Ancylobacter defluvii]|uniref:Carbon monoxide dehydrogenase n=1 Tax=Ancylobacter defluvii TaxID=1282440 RepID=A0A9W6ND89_9HYPH|nr:2Fe-2S iron-sulfur cluster-binding protein [Ancylobacter defluvii]MBS7588078.1 2Fe-2S iron-sulfur cluster binding domain-containing protein [Ancylobacter defluvii]GLK86470.1 carbon monoxide dehydrogenase [Ancylobacter defluvii]